VGRVWVGALKADALQQVRSRCADKRGRLGSAHRYRAELAWG